MPYKDDEVPEAVKGQPEGLISIYRSAFNAAYKEHEDEGKAAAIAWSAVKRKYLKGEGDKWVLKESVTDFVRRLKEDKGIWKMKDAEETKREVFRIAIRKHYGEDTGIVAIFPEVVIIQNWKMGTYSAVAYSMPTEESVEFGDIIEVEQVYIPISERIQHKSEARKIGKRIKESYRLPCRLIEKQSEQKYPRLEIGFAPADTFSRSKPPRLYPTAVLREAIEGMQANIAGGVFGTNAHTGSGKYDDLVWVIEKAWFDEMEKVGRCIVELLTDTPAGKVIEHLAQKGLPIKSSLSAWGDEKLDENVVDRNGRKGGFVVQSGLEIDGVDPLWNPAFKENSSRLLESLTQEDSEMNEEINKRLAEVESTLKPLTESLDKVTKELAALPKDAGHKLNEQAEFKTLTEQVKGLTEQCKTLADERAVLNDKAKAMDKVVAILNDSEQMKGYEHFRETIETQLKACKNEIEVISAFDASKKLLAGLPKPEDQEPVKLNMRVLRDESDSRFVLTENVEQAWKQLTESFVNTGNNGLAKVKGEEDVKIDLLKLQNPQWLAKKLMEQFIFWNVRDNDYDPRYSKRYNIQSIYEDVPTNPLYGCTKAGSKRLRAAVGDDHMATSDVAAANVHLLPHYKFFMKTAIENLALLVSIQPINKTSAYVYFWKEYYLASGTDTEINAANFSRTQSAKAEEAAAQQLKLMILRNTVSLETTLKVQTPINVETIQNAMFDHGIDLLAEGIELGRRELMREVISQVIYALLNATSQSNSDNLVQVAGSPINYSLDVPPGEGYSQAEWETLGLRKTIGQASGLQNKAPYNVRGNVLLGDSDYDYLFDTGALRTDDALQPSGVGIDRIGIWNKRYTYLSTDDAAVRNQLACAYRGPGPLDAALMFCPLVLFYIDDLVTKVGTMQKTRCFASRFALPKVVGSFLSIVNYIAD